MTPPSEMVERVARAIQPLLDQTDHAETIARAAIEALNVGELIGALEEARRYIANCWIDPVATDEERALVAKIDKALESIRSGRE